MEDPNSDFESMAQEQNKTDRNLLLQKFEELQQQHAQSLRDASNSSASNGNGENEDFEDIQFFHRLPQLQPIKLNINGSDVVRGALYDYNNTPENPFVFPDNVMEYGEPQFFPGSCVGYLETILEETDEEYEEEEGSSGRHWWTPDSDTDTDSVIRVDRVTSTNNPPAFDPSSISEPQSNIPTFPSVPFRTTASSKPFEMEDLYLFDQLDLAFEETLTKPRARTGFAFGQDNQQDLLFGLEHHPLLEKPATNSNPNPIPPIPEINNKRARDSNPSSDDEQPAEVNEEDFFYSTSEENSSLTTSSESEDTSSEEGGHKDGVVLAEFSLSAGFNSGLFKSHRRSFEGPSSKSNIRSFRSFDSLNSLAGTELLFSKADTFPSFQEFMKDAELPLPTPEGEETEDDTSPERDKAEVTRKSSGEMSTENLSEDSGICDGGVSGSAGALDRDRSSRSDPPLSNFIAKSTFALNPFLCYSSPENSILSSTGSNHSQSFEPWTPINPHILPHQDEDFNPTNGNSNTSTTTNSHSSGSIQGWGSPQLRSNSPNPTTVEESQSSEPHPSHSPYLEGNEPADNSHPLPSSPPGPTIPMVAPTTNPDSYSQILLTHTHEHLSVLDSSQNLQFFPTPEKIRSATGADVPVLDEDEEEDLRSNEIFKMLERELQAQDAEDDDDDDEEEYMNINITPGSGSSLQIANSHSQSHADFNYPSTSHMSHSSLGVGSRNQNHNEGESDDSVLQQQSSYEEGAESGPMSTRNDGEESLTLPSMNPHINPNIGVCRLTTNTESLADAMDDFILNALESQIQVNDPQPPALVPVVAQNYGREDADGKVSHLHQREPDSTTSGGGEHSSPLLPSRTAASSSISGDSILGAAADVDEGDGDYDWGRGRSPVSEPLVVKRRAWVCAKEEEEDVPDIIKIKSGSISDFEMEGTGAGTGSTTTEAPVPIKTYGRSGEFEVFLVSSRTPSPICPNSNNTVTGIKSGTTGEERPRILSASPMPGATGESGTLKSNKTVHFSPVVSEISWRESYTDQGSEVSESSSGENNLEQYWNMHDNNGEDEDEDTLNEDGVNQSAVIERVQIQSQVVDGPMSSAVMQNTGQEPPRLSMVPDLLSQCENVNPPTTTGHEPHFDVKIEAVGKNENDSFGDGFIEIIQPQVPPPTQQQIFPAMFTADSKDMKSKGGKKGKSKGFIIGKSKDKEKEKDKDKSKSKESITNEEASQKEKPSFFQRLSKIRLSGGSGNKSKSKAKIHPKEKENAEPPTSTLLKDKDETDFKSTVLINSGPTAGAPILKKPTTPSNPSPNPAINGSNFYNKNGHIASPHEGEECSAAFESILEEIAGLNTIRTRQARSTADNKRSFAERNQFLSNPEIDQNPREPDLESKLSAFKANASKTRDEIAKSHPDLETIEDVTRTNANAIKATSSPTLSSTPSPTSNSKKSSKGEEQQSGNTIKQEREWYKLLKTASEKYFYGGKVSKPQVEATTTAMDAPDYSSRNGPGLRSTGIVETDLDTGTSREMLDAEIVDLEKTKPPRPPLPKSPTGNGKARSLTNLASGGLKFSLPPDPSSPLLHNHQNGGSSGLVDIDTLANEVEERAKSFEFLLDETSKCSSVPPENQLRQEARILSEHELRIQRSLQKLNVPDWYVKHGYDQTTAATTDNRSSEPPGCTNAARTTTALKLLKRSEYGSANGLAGGWAGLSACRTPSLSSLQNSGRYTGSLTRSNFVRGRPATMSAMRSSRESLLSPSSTASQSPSAFERCSFTYGMPYSLSKYGQGGRLSSTSGASPANSSPPSTPGPLASAYTRKPYLGWRSQERLNAISGAPPKLSFYRPPAERLAAEVLTLRQKSASLSRPTGSDRPPLPKPPPRSENTSLTRREHEVSAMPNLPPNVHDSIREVTDAINQFVALGQDEPPRPTPRQKSGKKQAVWIESSFVGRKPRVTN